MTKERLLQIDLLKALAIISVLVLHTVKNEFLFSTNAVFHIWQAVPVFLIILGFNSSKSFLNKGDKSLKKLYSKEFFIDRFKRILIPFVIIFVLSYIIGLKQNRIQITELTLIGYLPVAGPGNYYITILLQYIFLSPLFYFLFSKNADLSLLLFFVLDLFYELASPSINLYSIEPYYYKASIMRCLFAIALGFWLANKKRLSIKDKLIIGIGSLISIFYLLLFNLYNYYIPYFLPDWKFQNLVSFFYPFLLVLAAIKLFPNHSNKIIFQWITMIGRASYHIFLFQILFFGLLTRYIKFYPTSSSSLISILLNTAICISIGILFYYANLKLIKKI